MHNLHVEVEFCFVTFVSFDFFHFLVSLKGAFERVQKPLRWELVRVVTGLMIKNDKLARAKYTRTKKKAHKHKQSSKTHKHIHQRMHSDA